MRRVYFSFDYERDLHRVRKFRRLPGMITCAPAGFQSTKVWDKAKIRGDDAVHGLIKDGLNNTTVTVICVGHMTSYLKYVNYEIERSLERGNGLVGITINHLRDQHGVKDPEGTVPPLLTISGYKVYKYEDPQSLARSIEEAAEIAAEQRQHDYRRKGATGKGEPG
jgi:hypothetical protein